MGEGEAVCVNLGEDIVQSDIGRGDTITSPERCVASSFRGNPPVMGGTGGFSDLCPVRFCRGRKGMGEDCLGHWEYWEYVRVTFGNGSNGEGGSIFGSLHLFWGSEATGATVGMLSCLGSSLLGSLGKTMV